MITREQALEIYRAGPEAVVKVICELSLAVDNLKKLVKELEGKVERLQNRVRELEEQLAKNSRNSGKPPSSDGPYNKPAPRSLRSCSGRKPGGQKGHEGHTMEMVDNPDRTIVHKVRGPCKGCGRSLEGQKPSGFERRQVVDIPPMRKEVIEHRGEVKDCKCGYVNKAEFPEGVVAAVQYGPNLRSVATYLGGYQLLPYHRTRELISDLFGIDLSEATLVNMINRCAGLLKEVVERIRRLVKGSPVINLDETGRRVEGNLWWLHTASTPELTYYRIHPRRGGEALADIGILPGFEGRAIHDHWNPYFRYDCKHGLCNAHHLRELIFFIEEQGQRWSRRMKKCLLDINDTVERSRKAGRKSLSRHRIRKFEARYKRILRAGYEENPLPGKRRKGRKKRGRIPKPKAVNLLDRLKNHESAVLSFMYDFNVPFTNNLVERDQRMAKVHEKISGTFRSREGAHAFCCIRSYISTARKNDINVIEAIQNAFAGAPFIPHPDTC